MTEHPDDPSGEISPYHPLERAQAVSKALQEAARRARFASRARGGFDYSSPEARRNARLTRYIRIALFVLIVAIPNICSLFYFSFIASDQYVAEAKFTVSSGMIPKMDALGSATGLPPAVIYQDTMVIVDFIESPDLIRRLEGVVDLREIYGSDSIDWWSRFNKNKSIEKFTSYWNKMVKVQIAFPAGIATLKVRAFQPQDAQKIALAVLSQCEALVNSLNSRMYEETVAASKRTLEQAAQTLKTVRIAYEQARNQEGVLDTTQTSNALSVLLTDLNGQLINAQMEYKMRSSLQGEGSPQIRLLKSKISSLEALVKQVQGQVTLTNDPQDTAPLSSKLGKFANLDLEQKIAETKYTAAAVEVESARLINETKMIYLHQIVQPALPEDYIYPQRVLIMSLFLIASLLTWVTLSGIINFIRHNMA